MMPQFSVIIPVYNKAKYIEETLKSALKQSFLDFEIIIIDDGSTDSSIEIIEQFSDNRIRFYKQENKGVSSARNLGIEKAIGELIAFLDADDYWYPNHLEELNKLYKDFPNCGMYCNRYKIKTSNKHFQEPIFRGIESNYRGLVKSYFYSNRPFRVSWTSALAITKNIIVEFNGFNNSICNGEDLELWTQIGIKYPVAISNQTTSIYNFNIESSLSKQNINSVKLMNFNQFELEEKTNQYLKEFLDLYRFFYAIHYKLEGNTEKAVFFYKDIDKKNIGIHNRFLFGLPTPIIKLLYAVKIKLKTIGIEFSTYN